MPFETTRSRWDDRRLYVATPMYGGSCTGAYANSLLALQQRCIAIGIAMMHSFIYNESLITRARNQLTDSFLRSDCTHLMFIDGDIGFRADDVIDMLSLMDEDSEYDVMAGVYPSKTIVWDRVRQAARNDKPDISRSGSRFVLKVPPETQVFLDRPTQALQVGTGFMMISRAILDKIQKANPTLFYTSDDHIHSKDGSGGTANQRHMFFQAAIDPQSRVYLSEDYWFCQKAIEAGGKVWFCPWIALDHIGNYTFSGSISDL